jgi:gas vesicle protein
VQRRAGTPAPQRTNWMGDMESDHSTEYVTAFVVGALVGVGAALLLAPEPPTRRERVMKELKPYRKKLRKQTAKMRKQAGRQVSAAGDWGEDLAAASRAVIQDLREEVASLVADARDEIAAAVETQLDSAHTSLRRGTKRIRS